MEVDLLDFVEQCRQLAIQALGKHVVLHCFRVEEDHSYRETPNRLKYMAEVRDALDLDRDDLPDYTTIYKSFDRLKMWVWRVLLRGTRSSTRSLATLLSTARFSTADVRHRISASGQDGRYRR